MPQNKLISLNPKFASVVDALFSLALLWWFYRFESVAMIMIWFAVRLTWWIILTQIVFYPSYFKRIYHLISLFIFNLGVVPYLIFSDPYSTGLARVFMVLVPAVSFWLVPSRPDSLSVMIKPHRRWSFFMSLFGIAGIWLALEASTVFHFVDGIWIFVAICLAALLTSLIGALEWAFYGLELRKEFFLLAGLSFLLLSEAGMIVYLWPIGYFVSSFFITWLWYVIWLLFRFNLSKEGINWAKQKVFLISNFILMLIYLLLIARWK